MQLQGTEEGYYLVCFFNNIFCKFEAFPKR
jgi:hypothetical protein